MDGGYGRGCCRAHLARCETARDSYSCLGRGSSYREGRRLTLARDGVRPMAADPHQVYDNPLVTRYASREMAELWGPQRKFRTWRVLWVALAEAEHELGLLADDG